MHGVGWGLEVPKGDKPGGGRICGSLRGGVLGLAQTLQGSPCLPDPFPRSSLRWGIRGGVPEKSRAGVGWGGMFGGAGRGEGAAAATFWLDAHLRPQGAGARLCASAPFPRTGRWPPRPPAVGLAPAAPPKPRQKGWRRGRSPIVRPRDDSIPPVMESLARRGPAAAPLPHQCPPPTCSAAELPLSPPPAWPRHRQGSHVLVYL